MFPKGAIKACEDIGVFGSDDQIGTPSGGQGEAADTAVGEEFDGFLHSELKMGGRVIEDPQKDKRKTSGFFEPQRRAIQCRLQKAEVV